MHTTSGPEGTCFHHNGDYSGAVSFEAPVAGGDPDDRADVAAPFAVLAAAAVAAGDAEHATIEVRGNGRSFIHQYTDETFTVVVPTVDLKALIGARVERERIAQLENASYEELFAVAAGAELGRWAAEPAVWS